MTKDQQSIAVVGSGVAGLTASWLLQHRHRVTLFERNNTLGGHTNTVVIPDGPDAGIAVDTGFIVLNDRTYPLFRRLLDRLGVATQDSDMSFGYFSPKENLYYAGTNLDGLFAQRINLIRPRFHQLVRGILRFCKQARLDLASGTTEGLTVADYATLRAIPQDVFTHYIVPMAAAIWSATQEGIRAFPATMLLRFWDNHGLLNLEDRPRWMTVAGGSHSYVKRMQATWNVELILGARLRGIHRSNDGARLALEDGSTRHFDRVIVATHADEALSLLDDPSDDERRLLGPWSYQANRTVLHTDTSVMPPHRRAWASWNYVNTATHGGAPVPVTYHMNRLQRLNTPRDYFVTLNALDGIRPESVVRSMVYTHPIYTFASLATQRELPSLNGVRNTFFCGSYFRHGFHEDAVQSAVAVAEALGCPL